MHTRQAYKSHLVASFTPCRGSSSTAAEATASSGKARNANHLALIAPNKAWHLHLNNLTALFSVWKGCAIRFEQRGAENTWCGHGTKQIDGHCDRALRNPIFAPETLQKGILDA
jgi:hypothetical protein